MHLVQAKIGIVFPWILALTRCKLGKISRLFLRDTLLPVPPLALYCPLRVITLPAIAFLPQ